MCNCNCCNRIKAEEILVEPGIITIIVPDGTEFKDGCCYEICLFKNIPVADNCSQIIVQNDVAKYEVFTNNANWWRPCKLNCRSILELQFCDDPDHFLILGVKK